jgi:hypothetical protein
MAQRVINTSEWPEFNFRDLPLCADSRRQLGGIYESVLSRGVSASRNRLRILLSPQVFDTKRGVYTPLSDRVNLLRKGPCFSVRVADGELQGGPVQPFCANALLIPFGYGEPSFRLDGASMPRLRVTNTGVLIATIEIDCKTREEFEATLSWTRGSTKAPFAAVDDNLCRFSDYRGYSIVFAGNRSLHFHFVFSTCHLRNCPADATGADRWGENQL